MSELKAQIDQLVVEELGDECVIYQTGTKKAYSLNPTAAWIWRHCDGTTDIDRMALQFQQEFSCENALSLIASGIRQLKAANLLTAAEDGKAASSLRLHSGPVMTRRSMVGASSALLPVIASILVPTAAAAKSKGYNHPVPTPIHGKNGGNGNNDKGNKKGKHKGNNRDKGNDNGKGNKNKNKGKGKGH